MPAESKEPKLAISTTCFFKQGLSEAPKYAAALLPPVHHIPEVHQALELAKKLGVGVEVTYRTRSEQAILEAVRQSRVPVYQIHGPIFDSLNEAILQGSQEASPFRGFLMNPGISLLALGTFNNKLGSCLELTKALGAEILVAHPSTVEKMRRRGQLIEISEAGINLAMEPDWKRPNPDAKGWIWDPREAAAVAAVANVNVCFDTAHQTISSREKAVQNLAGCLCDNFDSLHKWTKGVISIHVDGAIPGKDPWEACDREHAGLPLTSLPDDVMGAYREFRQHLDQVDYRGPLVLEFFHFFEGVDRAAAIEKSLNLLYVPKQPNRSFSIQSYHPTT